MRMNLTVASSLGIIALAWAHSAQAQNTATAPGSAIPPQVEQLLKEMSTYIGSATEFTFRADVIFDHVLPSGQKIQYLQQKKLHCSVLTESISNGPAI
jgi:hypothetical protein